MMRIEKVIGHLPISNSLDEKNKPEPTLCSNCGEPRNQLFIDIPLIGKRWVSSACPCVILDQEKFEAEQKRREKQHKIRKLLHLSSSTEQLREFTWDKLIFRPGMESAIEEVKEAVANFKERERLGILLFGESGNGKTFITSCGANELLKQGYSVIFLTEKDLLSRFRETNHFDNQERFFEIMNACLEADLLVWDDFLSSQKLDQKEKDWIFQVVNGRERANKPIWFTSNLTENELLTQRYAKVLDDKGRTWGRIIGNNNCVINSATNFRLLQAYARIRGVRLEDIEGF
jgi:DNA replication protein DnaC